MNNLLQSFHTVSFITVKRESLISMQQKSKGLSFKLLRFICCCLMSGATSERVKRHGTTASEPASEVPDTAIWPLKAQLWILQIETFGGLPTSRRSTSKRPRFAFIGFQLGKVATFDNRTVKRASHCESTAQSFSPRSRGPIIILPIKIDD